MHVEQILGGNARYSGEFVRGTRCGYGIMKYDNGDEYVGDWFDDRRHGTGKLTYPDGRSDVAVWCHDAFVRSVPS